MLPSHSVDKPISIHAPARGATSNSISVSVPYQISIHAPARGATFLPGYGTTLFFISIHAPARGATFYTLGFPIFIRDFNPRSREGSDLALLLHSQNLCYFNPRSREGSDGTPAPGHGTGVLFQSTLPRGERLDVKSCTALADNFNPRSREGSDVFCLF